MDINVMLTWVAEIVVGKTPEEIVAVGHSEEARDWTEQQWIMYSGVLGGVISKLSEEKRELEKEIEKLRRGR